MNKTLQDQLFEDVLSKFPKKSIAVEELTHLFGVGKDAVYRRLRGDTLLAPDELAALAQKFNLSLDSYVFEDANTVFCSFNPFTKEIKNVSDYLEGIHKLMGKVQHLPNTSMYYATSDVPLFVYFYFPEILQFKIYIWGRAVWMEVVSLTYWLLFVGKKEATHQCRKWQQYDKNHKARIEHDLNVTPSQVQLQMTGIILGFEQKDFLPKVKIKGKGRVEGYKFVKRIQYPVLKKKKKPIKKTG